MATTYDIGDQVRLIGRFTNEAGVLTNPTAVTCKVSTPSGVVTTYTSGASQVTSTETGVWSVVVDLTVSGVWSYRFAGTGAVKTADEAQFEVEASLLA